MLKAMIALSNNSVAARFPANNISSPTFYYGVFPGCRPAARPIVNRLSRRSTFSMANPAPKWNKAAWLWRHALRGGWSGGQSSESGSLRWLWVAG